jgi:hypothetical protein
MTVPTGQVVLQRSHPRPRVQHPLATRGGIELLGLLLAAGQHWRPLTARQRTALRTAYQRAIAAIPHDAPDGTVVPLPQLPAGTHRATVRSLIRRDLATPDGRLTILAVEVLAHVPDDKRPVESVTPRTELL